jgi:hypothetical protein
MEQLCIAQKVGMEKVLGDHKHNKAVVADLVVAEAVADLVVEAEEITKTLLSN